MTVGGESVREDRDCGLAASQSTCYEDDPSSNPSRQAAVKTAIETEQKLTAYREKLSEWLCLRAKSKCFQVFNHI
jgi:hypothetical protein